MSCLAEMKKERRRRKKLDYHEESMEDDIDCPSLNWLLSFKLDNIIFPKEKQLPERHIASAVLDGNVKKSSVVQPVQRFFDGKKPPYTYTELIERALLDKGELTVKGIYKWISDRFPFYKHGDEKWKNSVRHNLSINPHFRKGSRASNGAGHLWRLAANAMDLLPKREILVFEESSKENYRNDFNGGYSNVIVIDETALATASILQDHEFDIENTDMTCDHCKTLLLN